MRERGPDLMPGNEVQAVFDRIRHRHLHAVQVVTNARAGAAPREKPKTATSIRVTLPESNGVPTPS
jgi:hypothetical protein